MKNKEMDGQICTELRVQVEGSGTLPDPEASALKSLVKEEELINKIGR